MKVILGDNLGQKKWDEFVTSNSSDFGLLQSWGWGEFIKKTKKQENKKIRNQRSGIILRLMVVETGHVPSVSREQILAVVQIIKQPLKLGKSYFYIPRGPIIRRDGESISKILDLLLGEVQELAKKENCIFLRLDPSWQENYLDNKNLKFVGQVQPKQTLILDLDKIEEELLAGMKAKTRYNIKVAQKHGVEIIDGPEYFEDFWRLMQKTSSRQEIVPHIKDYYQKMLESLGDSIKLIVAKFDQKIIVANLVVFFGDWCVYLHGASDYQYRQIMAPYLLQWETIKLAKQAGKKYYDFWGVDQDKWPGVTRFKTGFAPKQKFTKYIGAWDEVYSKFWYTIYNLLKKK